MNRATLVTYLLLLVSLHQVNAALLLPRNIVLREPRNIIRILNPSTSIEEFDPLRLQSVHTRNQNEETGDVTGKDDQAPPHYRLHYPTAGGMYDISEGPGHHLINVDHDKLTDLGDKSVSVHEMKLDAVTVTFLSFTLLALFLFVFAFSDGGGLDNLIAWFQNASRTNQ